MLNLFLIFYVFIFLSSLQSFLIIIYQGESKKVKEICENTYCLENKHFFKNNILIDKTKCRRTDCKIEISFKYKNETVKKKTGKRKSDETCNDNVGTDVVLRLLKNKKIKQNYCRTNCRNKNEIIEPTENYYKIYNINNELKNGFENEIYTDKSSRKCNNRKIKKYYLCSIGRTKKEKIFPKGKILSERSYTCKINKHDLFFKKKKYTGLQNLHLHFHFINTFSLRKHIKKRRTLEKNYLRKFEDLYEKYTIKEGEEQKEDDEDKLDDFRSGWRNVTNTIIDEWCLTDHPDKYNVTLLYNYLANAHNLEFKNLKSVNNFIKNNEVIEKEKYEKLNKPYLTYIYKFPYIHPNKKKQNSLKKNKIDYYTYHFHIPKLINYEEDISTESRYVPANFKNTQPFKHSPINYLTTSGFSSRNIDTFGPERNKIYSFNTPTDIKRNIFFNDLMLISTSYNQHFFHNLPFLLNLHTLQILLRDKTAIETEFYMDKFDQLQKILKMQNENDENKETDIDTNTDTVTGTEIDTETEIEIETEKQKEKENEKIKKEEEKKWDTEKVSEKEKEKMETDFMKEDKNNNVGLNVNSEKNDTEKLRNEKKIDEEIEKYISQRKFKIDEQIENFPKKYVGDILKDSEFINLWKYNKKGEIQDKLNTIPIPNIYLHIDDPKYYAWKILQCSGKTAFKEIPTPNRKLEAWRQQINLKQFYKLNFDASISVRHISKNELDKFKMKQEIKKTEMEMKMKMKMKMERETERETDHEKLIQQEIKEAQAKNKNAAIYTLVVRDGIVDEYLSDDINILKNLNKKLISQTYKNGTNDTETSSKMNETEKVNEKEKINENEQMSEMWEEEMENSDGAKNKSQIYVGSFFKIKDAELSYLINKELYFIPEYTNWHKTNTQPFIRGQIAKQSRKFDNDYPIYDYRKSDFGMAKFSALNLASIKDCAVIFLKENIDLSNVYFHVIFLSTSKSEDEKENETEDETVNEKGNETENETENEKENKQDMKNKKENYKCKYTCNCEKNRYSCHNYGSYEVIECENKKESSETNENKKVDKESEKKKEGNEENSEIKKNERRENEDEDVDEDEEEKKKKKKKKKYIVL